MLAIDSLLALYIFSIVVAFAAGVAFSRRHRDIPIDMLILVGLACIWLMAEYSAKHWLSFLSGGSLSIVVLVSALCRWVEDL
jgi:hypothetical protein